MDDEHHEQLEELHTAPEIEVVQEATTKPSEDFSALWARLPAALARPSPSAVELLSALVPLANSDRDDFQAHLDRTANSESDIDATSLFARALLALFLPPPLDLASAALDDPCDVIESLRALTNRLLSRVVPAVDGPIVVLEQGDGTLTTQGPPSLAAAPTAALLRASPILQAWQRIANAIIGRPLARRARRAGDWGGGSAADREGFVALGLGMVDVAAFLPALFRQLERMERIGEVDFLESGEVNSIDRIHLAAILTVCQGTIAAHAAPDGPITKDPSNGDVDTTSPFHRLLETVLAPTDPDRQCHIACEAVGALLDDPSLERRILLSSRRAAPDRQRAAVADALWTFLRRFSTPRSLEVFQGCCCAALRVLAAEASRLLQEERLAGAAATSRAAKKGCGAAAGSPAVQTVLNPALNLGRLVFLRPLTDDAALAAVLAPALTRPDGKLLKKDLTAGLGQLRALFGASPSEDCRPGASAALARCLAAGLSANLNFPAELRGELLDEIKKEVDREGLRIARIGRGGVGRSAAAMDLFEVREEDEMQAQGAGPTPSSEWTAALPSIVAAVIAAAEGDPIVKCRRSAVACLVALGAGGVVPRGADEEFYLTKALAHRCCDRDGPTRAAARTHLSSATGAPRELLMECLSSEEWRSVIEVAFLDDSSHSTAGQEQRQAAGPLDAAAALLHKYLASGFDQPWALLSEIGVLASAASYKALVDPEGAATARYAPAAAIGGHGSGPARGRGALGSAAPSDVALDAAVAANRAALLAAVDAAVRGGMMREDWFSTLGKWSAKNLIR